MREDISEYTINVLGSIEISKGMFTKPFLSLMQVINTERAVTSYKLIEHTKVSYPTKRSLAQPTGVITDDYKWWTISNTEADILCDAIDSWETDKNPRLMGYSYLYAYCRAKGLDLHEDLKVS